MINENDNWVGVEKLPAYNPFMFEMARHVRGQSITQASRCTRISSKKIQAIENGDHVPNRIDIERLAKWYNFPLGFFEQWWDTQLDISGYFGKNVPIDYMKYKVFRELNPNFTRMKVHFTEPEKPQAKIIDFKKV